MADQETGVTSEELNVHSAATVFEGLLSDEEDSIESPEPKKTPAPEKPASEEGQPEAEPETEQPAPEGEEKAEPDPEDEPQQPELITVIVDGKEEQLPLEEVRKGYSRTADYTRKTQALAEERKSFQADKDRVTQLQQRYTEYLGQLEDALGDPKEPDWDKLREESPDEFATTWADWQRHQQRKEAVRKEREGTMQQLAETQMEQLRTHLDSEREKLVAAIPEWKNDEVAKKERGEIRTFANDLGFTDDEINRVTDHRLILLLRKAVKGDKVEKTAPVVRKQLEQKTTVIKPGTVNSKRKPVSEITRGKQRLAQTGRTEDAAAVFEQMIDD